MKSKFIFAFIMLFSLINFICLVSAYTSINGSQYFLDVSAFHINISIPDVSISCYDTYDNLIFLELTDNYGFIPSQYLYEYENKTINTINFTSAYDPCFGRFTAPVVFETDNSLNILFGDYYGQWFGKTWNGSEFLGNTSVVSGIYAYGDGQYSEPMVWEMNNTIYLITYVNRVTYGNMDGYKWNGNGWDSDSSVVSGLYPLFKYEPPNVFNIGLNYYAIQRVFGAEEYRGFQWNGAGWIENSSVLDLGSPYSTTFYFNYDYNSYRIFPRLACYLNQYGINAEIYNGTDWVPTFTSYSNSNIYYSNYTLYADKYGYDSSSKIFNLTSNLGLTFLLNYNTSEPICSTINRTLCLTQEDCEEVGLYWYINENEPTYCFNGEGYYLCPSCQLIPATCHGSRGYSPHLEVCDNEEDCLSEGGYWYNGVCNLIPYVPPIIPPVEEKGFFSSLFYAFEFSSISLFIIILGILFAIYKLISHIFS